MPDNSTDVKVGKMIAVIVDKGDDWKSAEVPKTEETSAGQESAKTKDKAEKSATSTTTETKKVETKEKAQPSQSDKQPVEQSQYVSSSFLTKKLTLIGLSSHAMGPAARTLLEQYGIEASKIQGTGPHGVVMKRFGVA
jgi:pyruvate dehydrogenase E2 component (dihydrolipoamide acetyltransferase)